MAVVNRFDVPADAKFINTHVPIPFEELRAAAQARQDRADKNWAMLDNAQAMASQLNYIPNSQDQVYIQGVQKGLSQLNEQFVNEDLSDPDIYRKLRKAIMEVADPNKIKAIQDSYSGYMQYQKQLADYESKGYGPDASLIKDFTGYDTLGDDQIFTGLPTRGQDLQQAYREFFGDVGPTFLGTAKDEYGMMRDVHGVTPERLLGYATDNFEAFRESPAGQYLAKVAVAKGLDPDQYIQQTLAEEAPKFAQNQYSRPFNLNAGGKQETPDRPTITFVQKGASLEEKDPVGAGDMSFTDKGEAKATKGAPKEKERRNILASAPGVMDLSNIERSIASSGKVDVPKEVNKQKINNMVDLFPAIAIDPKTGKQATDEQIYQAYKDITKDMSAIAMPSMVMDEEARKETGTLLADMLGSIKFEINDEFGRSTFGDVNEDTRKSPKADLGYSIEELKEGLRDPKNENITVNSFSIGDGAESGQIILDVIDKSKKGGGKGKLRKVYINTTINNAEGTMALNELYDKVSNAKEGFVHTGYNSSGVPVGVKVIPTPQYDWSKNKWVYNMKLLEGPLDISLDGTINGFAWGNSGKDTSYREQATNIMNMLLDTNSIAVPITSD